MAPGEVVTFDLEYVLPEDQLLGEYQVVAMVDPDDEVEENVNEQSEIEEASSNEKIEDILTSRGYKKVPLDSRFGPHGNFDAFVEFAQNQLSGENRDDDVPHQGLGIFFERDVMNVLADLKAKHCWAEWTCQMQIDLYRFF